MLMAIRNMDLEKLAFDHFEMQEPAVADLLLVMAARQVSLENLIGQLQGLVRNRHLLLQDFDIAVAALVYARRYVTAPIRSH